MGQQFIHLLMAYWKRWDALECLKPHSSFQGLYWIEPIYLPLYQLRMHFLIYTSPQFFPLWRMPLHAAPLLELREKIPTLDPVHLPDKTQISKRGLCKTNVNISSASFPGYKCYNLLCILAWQNTPSVNICIWVYQRRNFCERTPPQPVTNICDIYCMYVLADVCRSLLHGGLPAFIWWSGM